MRSLLLLLALCAITLSFAVDANNPQLASAASVQIVESGTISATGGHIASLELDIPIPVSSSYQEVQAGGQSFIDGQGNPYIQISESSPSNPFTYSKSIFVRTDKRDTTSLPESFQVPQSLAQYLQPSSLTQSDDSRIKALAEGITAGAQTPFEKISKLAIYVNTNMTYDTSVAGQSPDAIWIMQNRRGVCTEYSRLFVALARSMGIPARFAEGYVYSQDFKSWMGHTWAEAYVGEWVPVDATWFEVGSLDAMHVEEAKYAEDYDRMTLSTKVTPPGTIPQWETSGNKTGAAVQNVKATNMSYLPAQTDFDLVIVEPRLTGGGKTLAYLTMEGKDYSVVPVMLANCLGNQSIGISDPQQYLVMSPGRNSTAVWEITASPLLSTNYIYTCPLTLNSPYLQARTATITVAPDADALPFFEASLEKQNIGADGNNSAILNRLESRQGKPLTVITKGGAYTQTITSYAQSLTFPSSGIGNLSAYVAAGGGGFYKLYYQAGGQGSGQVSLSVPQFTYAGQPVNASVLVSPQAYPADVKLDFYFGDAHQTQSARITQPGQFQFQVTPPLSGPYIASIKSTVQGACDGKNQLVQVIDVPQVAIESVATAQNGGSLSATISFSKSGSPASPAIKLNGATYPAAAPLTLPLPAGDYNATLAWSDAAGANYSQPASFTVAPPSLLDGLSAKAGPASCLPAMLVAFLLAAVLIRR